MHPCANLAAKSASTGLQLGPPFSSLVPHTNGPPGFMSAALDGGGGKKEGGEKVVVALRIKVGSNYWLLFKSVTCQVNHRLNRRSSTGCCTGLTSPPAAVVLQPDDGHLGGLS
jgi:hypothetical protein